MMMTDMSGWPAMNAAYIEHFQKHLRARVTVGSSALALDGRIEVDCIATVDLGA